MNARFDMHQLTLETRRQAELMWESLPHAYTRINPHQAGRNLKHVKKVLGGIPFFLAFGTLLGAVRDGDLIPHDTDCDLIVLEEAVPLIMELLKADAFLPLSLCRIQETFISLCDGRDYIDIYLFTAEETHPSVYRYCGGMKDSANVERWRLSHPFKVEFVDEKWPIPACPHSLLARWYGHNWRTPNTSWQPMQENPTPLDTTAP